MLHTLRTLTTLILILLFMPAFSKDVGAGVNKPNTLTFRFTDRMYQMVDDKKINDAFTNLTLMTFLTASLKQQGFVNEPDDITHIILDYELRENSNTVLAGKGTGKQLVVVIRAFRDGADDDAYINNSDILYYEHPVLDDTISSDTRMQYISEVSELFVKELMASLRLNIARK